jgi:hypothetical protein
VLAQPQFSDFSAVNVICDVHAALTSARRKGIEPSGRYAHTVVHETAREADLLPTPPAKRGKSIAQSPNPLGNSAAGE